jgi:hypothetical protein
LFVCCGGGVVGCEDSIGVDAIEDVGRWMEWDVWMDEKEEEGRVGKQQEGSIKRYFCCCWLHQGMRLQARVTRLA